MCILLWQDKGEDSIRGTRCVEILGFHYDDKEKRMFFLLHLQNLRTNNYLNVLHIGNTTLEIVEPSLSLQHQDEPANSHLLKSVYGKAFKYSEGEFWHKKGLSAWDSWHNIGEGERVILWPGEDKNASVDSCQTLYPNDDKIQSGEFVPFTVWRLGPFTRVGAMLIALRLNFTRDSYDKVVLDQPLFSVDGPEPLLSAISHSYIPFDLGEGEQEEARKWLEKFGNYTTFSNGYDVIIIKPPYADEVRPLKLSSIVKAPIQPRKADVADRFITANPWFTMTLRYEDRLDEIARNIEGLRKQPKAKGRVH